jgi:hypothetical protein
MSTMDYLKHGMARPQAARWGGQDGTQWPVPPSNRVAPLRSRTVSCRDAAAISGIGTEGRS